MQIGSLINKKLMMCFSFFIKNYFEYRWMNKQISVAAQNELQEKVSLSHHQINKNHGALVDKIQMQASIPKTMHLISKSFYSIVMAEPRLKGQSYQSVIKGYEICYLTLCLSEKYSTCGVIGKSVCCEFKV
jgi:hypothetical protein